MEPRARRRQASDPNPETISVYVKHWRSDLLPTAKTSANKRDVSLGALVEAALVEWLEKRRELK